MGHRFCSEGGSIPLVGFLLIVTGSLHVFYSFRRISELEQRSEASRGKLTILAGLLVFYAPAMVSTAAIVLVALLLAFLAAQTIVSEIRNWRKSLFNRSRLIEPFLSIGLAVTFLLARDLSARILIGFAAAYWQFSAGWAIWSVPSRDLLEASEERLSLSNDPELRRLARTMAEQSRRRPVDRSWIFAFLLVLFAIHVGRMQTDWDLVGMISPESPSWVTQ